MSALGAPLEKYKVTGYKKTRREQRPNLDFRFLGPIIPISSLMTDTLIAKQWWVGG